jgi:hypothetical protein
VFHEASQSISRANQLGSAASVELLSIREFPASCVTWCATITVPITTNVAADSRSVLEPIAVW